MTGAIYLCVTRGEEWGDTEGASGLGAGRCSGSNGDPNGDNRDLSGANGDPSGDLSGVTGGGPNKANGDPNGFNGNFNRANGSSKAKGGCDPRHWEIATKANRKLVCTIPRHKLPPQMNVKVSLNQFIGFIRGPK